METAALFTLVIIAAAGGSMAAFSRNVLYCIIGLGIALIGTAGLYVALAAPFVAAMQVLIYIGGIGVAMVFAMMLSVSMAVPVRVSAAKRGLAAACGILFFVAVGRLIITADFPGGGPAPQEMWGPKPIGAAFLGPYALAFETLSVVLLIAVIGAVLIAKKERDN